jgi:methylase of polypeptide subunit release factors
MIQGDMCDALAPPAGFDFILINPPWRIVPEQVAYPNPRARVGWGRDGLDAVRRFLRDVPKLASAGDSAIIRVDFPGTRQGFSFERELADFVGKAGFRLLVRQGAPIDISDQSMISAQTCVHLNSPASVTELARRFADNYRRLGFDTLYPSLCELQNDRSERLEIKSGQAGLTPTWTESSESDIGSKECTEVLA